MSLHQKQIKILKDYFEPIGRYKDKGQRASLILIARENTLLTMSQISRIFHVCENRNTEIKQVNLIDLNEKYRLIHKENVENLKKKGFLFI